MVSRRASRSKWADDPPVPISRKRLQEAIDCGRTRREVAAAVTRRVESRPRARGKVNPTLASQTLDNLCTPGKQVTCRASIRRELAGELGVPERWLADDAFWPHLTAEAFLSTRKRYGEAWKLPSAWSDLVLSLQLPPAVHGALLDLPGAIGQASLALGLIVVDKTGAIKADAKIGRSGLLEFEAWHSWLQAWIELEGRETVRAILTREVPNLRTRFAHVNRYAMPRTKRVAARSKSGE